MKENETKKFDQKAYIAQYQKTHYKDIKQKVKPEIFEKITKYCEDVQISRQEFMINCALYAIDNNMIDEIRLYIKDKI